ncbi:MAG: helix-turn-helix domain-containing protein [Candidatus Thorarchaeota archaeon]
MSGSESVQKAIPVLSKNLGLTPTESKVFLPILLGGNMTHGAIVLMTGLSNTKVRKALNSLMEKNLIIHIDGVVPVYRALPPSLALADVLAGVAEEMMVLGEKAEGVVVDGVQTTDETLQVVTDARKDRMKYLRQHFESHDSATQKIVQTQVDTMIKVASESLSGFFSTAEQTLKTLEASLDDNLGTVLSDLMKELDATQQTFSDTIAMINKEFQEYLDSEEASSKDLLHSFASRAENFIENTRAVADSIMSSYQKRIEEAISVIAEGMKAKASTATEPALEILHSAAKEINNNLVHITSQLAQVYNQVRESLQEILSKMTKINEEYAESVTTKMRQALEVTKVMHSDIDAWKNEAVSLVDSAAQTVTNHLKQISSVDASYLDGMENTLSQYLETTSTLLSDEYSQVRNLVASIRKDFDTLVTDSRTSVVKMLQAQNQSDQERLKAARDTLLASLDSGVKRTQKQVSKHITQAVSDISTVLDTEVNELTALVENLDSRLRSAFGTIVSSTKTRNSTVLSGVQKFADEFESSFVDQLEDILNRFSNQISTQAEKTKSLYEGINTRLDERLVQSITTIRSHVSRVDTEIETALADQLNRLDRHADGIRQEFHVQIDELTQQFISLVQGLEVSFNGFLSNQTLEARDLIKSTHTSFKEAVKQEMSTLHDDSLKLQQEYASEIGSKIDEVIESAETARKALEDLTVTHREQVTSGLHQTLVQIQNVLESIESSLREIESGTVRQVGENLVQLTHEFENSVRGAGDNIAERLETAQESLVGVLKKSVMTTRSATDGFLSQEADHKQNFVAEVSKKLDALSTKIGKSSASKFETYGSALAERETALVQSRNQLKDAALAGIRQRRAEAIEALDAAAVWIDSTMTNVASSVNTIGNKLDNEVTVIQQGLVRAASDVSKAILDKGADNVQQVEKLALGLINRVESLVSDQLTEFTESSSAQVERSQDGITSVQRNIENISVALIEQASVALDDVIVEVDRQLEGRASEVKSTLDTTVSSFETSTKRTQSKILEARDNLFDASKEALKGMNLRVMKKFETSGITLKTRLSSDIYTLSEVIRNEISSANERLSDTAAVVNTALSEETSKLKSKRDEVIQHLESEFDKSLKDWATVVKNNLDGLKNALVSTMTRLSKVAEASKTTVAAIREASDVLTTGNNIQTWYLTGEEEMCAHMFDMATRAKSSIVISVSSTKCLNLKKLAKVDGPSRKVLIIPESIEDEPAFKAPEGWRILELKNPPSLAVRDDAEIVIGGIEGEGNPFAIVSTEPRYLRLYHDIIGPQIIRKKKRG